MTHPLLYEINTRCWLRELSVEAGELIHLGNIPKREFKHWLRLGFTHIWLMGVWKTGARARRHSLSHPELRRLYSQALPGWCDEDVSGSPYAIAAYEVSDALGGEENLRKFRQRLNEHGLQLILDFVPNHLGLDHNWIHTRPELFIQSSTALREGFRRKTRVGMRWFAHGKDPGFPAWSDTVQLDFRNPATRAAMIEELKAVAELCDGVRCDMAMLLLNDVFERTWPSADGVRAGASEFWSEAIDTLKTDKPRFVFLAEAYWNLEERLQACGFDFTYDKRLYDYLLARDPAAVQRHLLTLSSDTLVRSAHFLENHDEPRIASRLSLQEHAAAALMLVALPGMRLLHEGQLAGACCSAPVHLGRRSFEVPQPGVVELYERLLGVTAKSAVGRGLSQVLQPRAAWPDNPTDRNFVIVQWQRAPAEFELAVINLAPHRSQCFVTLRVEGLNTLVWEMRDVLGSELHVRDGRELEQRGLYLDLPAHGAQLFRFQPR